MTASRRSRWPAQCTSAPNFGTYRGNGTQCGIIWNQERPDELWVGRRNEPSQIILKDPAILKPAAAAYADLPGGQLLSGPIEVSGEAGSLDTYGGRLTWGKEFRDGTAVLLSGSLLDRQGHRQLGRLLDRPRRAGPDPAAGGEQRAALFVEFHPGGRELFAPGDQVGKAERSGCLL